VNRFSEWSTEAGLPNIPWCAERPAVRQTIARHINIKSIQFSAPKMKLTRTPYEKQRTGSLKSTAEFAKILEGEIIPLLRRQRGFEDAIAFIAPERNEAVDISLWDKKEDAEAYHRGKYPEVLRALARVVEGNPTVETFEVSNSTSHQIPASAVA
jgi:hypothetical protein